MIKVNLQKEPIPDRLKEFYLKSLNPVIQFFSKRNLNPNAFTTIGFIIGVISAIFLVFGRVRISAFLLLLGSAFDSMDGKLARDSGKVTRFGALFDSTMDRFSEAIYFLALSIYFFQNHYSVTAIIAVVALSGSLMVSYVRARAEGLAYDCKIGFLQRPIRIILIGLGGLIHPYVLIFMTWLIALMSHFTAIQRLMHVYHQEYHSVNKN